MAPTGKALLSQQSNRLALQAYGRYHFPTSAGNASICVSRNKKGKLHFFLLCLSLFSCLLSSKVLYLCSGYGRWNLAGFRVSCQLQNSSFWEKADVKNEYKCLQWFYDNSRCKDRGECVCMERGFEHCDFVFLFRFFFVAEGEGSILAGRLCGDGKLRRCGVVYRTCPMSNTGDITLHFFATWCRQWRLWKQEHGFFSKNVLWCQDNIIVWSSEEWNNNCVNNCVCPVSLKGAWHHYLLGLV